MSKRADNLLVQDMIDAVTKQRLTSFLPQMKCIVKFIQ